MSRLIFWNEDEIVRESIYRTDECRYKTNGICFNNLSKNLGRKCHTCNDFMEEDNKVEPY